MSFVLHQDHAQLSDPFGLPCSCSNVILRAPKQLSIHPHLPRLKTVASYDSLRLGRIPPFQAETVNLRCSSTPSLPSLPSPLPITNLPLGDLPVTPVDSDAGDQFPFPLRPRPLRSSSCYPETPTRKNRGWRPSLTSSPSTPSSPSDRYVPKTRSSESIVNAFRATRSPEELSPAERLLRNRAASHSPFQRARIPRTPFHSSDTRRRIQTTFLRGAMVRSRAASAGTIWTVPMSSHIVTSPVTPVSDGRGRLLGSGTNAPISSANFFPGRPRQAINKQFESKLAAALEIDHTSRVLQIAAPDLHRLSVNASPQKSTVEAQLKDGIWSAEIENKSRSYIRLLVAPLT
jgi:hypothetical protein